MKIRRVKHNNHRKALEVFAGNRVYHYPYSRLRIRPSKANVIREAFVDRGSGKQSLTYVLQSGDEGTVHIDHIIEYNRKPTHLGELMLDKLTEEARRRVERSSLSKREIVRRLGTSASQLYRILDRDNHRTSIQRVLALLEVLECDVEVSVVDREEAPAGYGSDGVDVSLIRWTLSLTPAERLRTLQQHVNSVVRLRDGKTRR
jgi:hypothetical protein